MASNRPLTTNYNWPLLFPQGNQITEISVLDSTLSQIDTDVHALAETISNFKVSFHDIQDKPDTLAGYGITDAYTSAQTDKAIEDEADALKGDVPADLSTLEALANAIADDPKFSETVAAALANRVSVAEQQSFNLAQKKQARDNVEALGTVDKGAANGVAPLDAGSKVPTANLPQLTTTATVGVAMAGANSKAAPADGDFFAGVEAGGSTMFKTTWANIKSALAAIFIKKSGDTLTGQLRGVAVSGNTSSFWTTAQGGAYSEMYNRGAGYTANAGAQGSSYLPVIAGRYANNGWAGVWSAGVINYQDGKAAGFSVHHINSSGSENVVFEYGADGTFSVPRDVKAAGSCYAGNGTASLQSNGNVTGSIWNNFGAGDAYTAIHNRIEDRSYWRSQDWACALTADAIGSTMLLSNVRGSAIAINEVVAGSSLRVTLSDGDGQTNGRAPGGAWRNISDTVGNAIAVNFVRAW